MTAATAVKMLKFRWIIFAILALAYFFVYFHRLSLSVVANDIVNYLRQENYSELLNRLQSSASCFRHPG